MSSANVTKPAGQNAFVYPINYTGPTLTFIPFKYSFTSPTSGDIKDIAQFQKGNPLGYIQLYAPKDINLDIKTEWSPTTIPSATGLVKTAIQDIIKKTGEMGAYMMAQRGGAFEPTSINIFKNIENISTQFIFNMIPNNATEAKMIENIVKYFRIWGTPPKPEVKDLTSLKSLFIKFPCIFNIVLTTPNSGSTTGLMNYTYMAMTGYNVSYGEGDESYYTFKDGQPVETKLTLAFTSILPYVLDSYNYDYGEKGMSPTAETATKKATNPSTKSNGTGGTLSNMQNMVAPNNSKSNSTTDWTKNLNSYTNGLGSF